MKSLNLACFALALSALSTPVLAEQRVDVNIPGGGAQDLLNMTSIPSTISDHSYDPTMQKSCTNAEGRVVHQRDPEYQSCIEATEGSRGGGKTPPGGASASPNGGSHVITIQEPAPSN